MSESSRNLDLDLNFGLEGKTAIVTGGASGIGAAISTAFAAKGASVVIFDRQSEAAQQQAERVRGDVSAQACEVSRADSVEEAVRSTLAVHETIDILVNSAGIVSLAPAEELAQTAWDNTIAVNLTGTFLMSQTVGQHMLNAGKGRIINLASQAATVALHGHVAYCASKFGVVGLTKVLASEWAGRGVTVNTISPTVVLTDLGRKAWDGPQGDAMKAMIPTGRFAVPEEIAAAAIFLASDAAGMVNGADLLVDGGYTIR